MIILWIIKMDGNLGERVAFSYWVFGHIDGLAALSFGIFPDDLLC